jgi:hypothetical protein
LHHSSKKILFYHSSKITTLSNLFLNLSNGPYFIITTLSPPLFSFNSFLTVPLESVSELPSLRKSTSDQRSPMADQKQLSLLLDSAARFPLPNGQRLSRLLFLSHIYHPFSMMSVSLSDRVALLVRNIRVQIGWVGAWLNGAPSGNGGRLEIPQDRVHGGSGDNSFSQSSVR